MCSTYNLSVSPPGEAITELFCTRVSLNTLDAIRAKEDGPDSELALDHLQKECVF